LIHLMKIDPYNIGSIVHEVTDLLTIVNYIFVQRTILQKSENYSTHLSNLMSSIVATWQHHAIKQVL